MTLDLQAVQTALGLLGERVGASLQIIDAAALAEQYHPELNPGQPVLIVGPADDARAADLGTLLARDYPAEHEVELLGAGRRQQLRLADLAAVPALDAGACLFLPALARPADYTALQNVVARLRAPNGCPWDRELTWAKLRSFVLEESYELLAALDSEDPAKVAEELGDLLLEIALVVEIATETGAFRLPDVLAGIVAKLIRRHPHVFGDAVVSGTDEVLANWEAIKRAERAENGAVKRSPLAGVPAGLPALAQAEAYIERVARLRTLEAPEAPWAELAQYHDGQPVPDEVVGRALFGLVAWARAHGVEPESALRTANADFAAQIADPVE